VYVCLLPYDLARAEPAMARALAASGLPAEVRFERRRRERRGPERRRLRREEPTERRRVRNAGGRRVADRRAFVHEAPLPPVPGLDPEQAARIRLVERLEAPPRSLEDADTARLVCRAQAGEREPLHVLYERYFDRVYRYVRMLVRDHDEAEDLCQETFIRALQSLDRYERRSMPFRAWLFRIARNAALHRLEKRRRLAPQRPEDLHEQPASPEPIADTIADRRLVELVEQLPLPQRQVIFLRFCCDLDTLETAAVMGRTPDAARQLQARAMRELRRRIGEIAPALAAPSPG